MSKGMLLKFAIPKAVGDNVGRELGLVLGEVLGAIEGKPLGTTEAVTEGDWLGLGLEVGECDPNIGTSKQNLLPSISAGSSDMT